MATLFLSYSRDDQARIKPLAAALERAGHKVWWDSHISGGEEFAGAIEQALEAADVVIVAWSESSIRSAWVRDEAAAGRDRARLVPVAIDTCLPPLGFRQFQTIDLSAWSGRQRSRALRPLLDAVESKASPRGPQDLQKPLPVRIVPKSRRAVAIAAALLLLVAGGWLLYPKIMSWPRSGAVASRVAIGEFSMTSADLPRQLPHMINQEILAAFGAENAVSVVSASGQPDGSAPFVMRGSMARVGSGIRITANLVNESSGVVLWSDAFEHEAADAVAVRQAAVGASQVVRCGLWGASNYGKRMSDQALALYFSWCNEHWSGSAKETAELDAARRVTVAVPDFSFGWSALALAAVPLVHQAGSDDAAGLRKEAETAARKSIALDSRNPEGYMALAGLLPSDRYAQREELLRKAISVRPTECGCERQAYGDFLASVGRMEESAEEYERARAMRPLAPFSNLRFAQALYVVGRNQEADRVLTDTLELWPQATSLLLLKMKSALWTRRYDDAIAALGEPDLPLASRQRDALAASFEALEAGNPSLAAAAAAELEQFADDPRRNDRIVVATLAALGSRDAALRAAANLVRNRGLLNTDVLFEPNLAAVRDEPGYADLVRSLGLTAYWRSGRHPPDMCRGSAKPAFCSLS